MRWPRRRFDNSGRVLGGLPVNPGHFAVARTPERHRVAGAGSAGLCGMEGATVREMATLVLLLVTHSCASVALPAARVDAPMSASKHGVYEISLAVPEFEVVFDEDGSRQELDQELLNPFLTEVVVKFSHTENGKVVSPSGFYDGGGVWRVRLSPPDEGLWSWSTSSDHSSLHGHTGSLHVLAAKSAGCPKASPGQKGFEYPDGRPYTPVGTTCYSWVHQDHNGAQGDPDVLEQNTLKNLKASPFNKVRMTGFPKWSAPLSCSLSLLPLSVSVSLDSLAIQVSIHAP